MKNLPAFLLFAIALAPGLPAQPVSDKAPAAFGRVVPERKDDVAWENDLTAYRTYGPALKNSPEHENSGIDVWFKRVPYPILDKWYRDDLAGRRSYHVESPEGYDGFKVGDTRGDGGTALWRDGRLLLSGVYRTASVLSSGPKEAKLLLAYRYETPEGPVDEAKTISLKVGRRWFDSHSVFTRDGKPLAGLPVAIGLVTQTKKAEITLDPKDGIMAVWDFVDHAGFGIGMSIAPAVVAEMLRQPTSDGREHALCIVKTDAAGAVDFRAGSVWSKAGRIKSASTWLTELKKATPQD